MKIAFLLVIVFSLSNVYAELSLCKQGILPKANIEEITYEYSVNIDHQTIQPKLKVSWKLLVPEGSKIDGFLVLLKGDKDDQSLPAIEPGNICDTGSSSFWVNSTDGMACSKKSTNCDDYVTSSHCLYDVIHDADCLGTNNFFMKENGFSSVQSTTRNLQFNVEFEENYQFYIYVYYRKYVNYQAKKNMLLIEPSESCFAMASEKLVETYSKTEASKLCNDYAKFFTDNYAMQSPLIRLRRATRRLRQCRVGELIREAIVYDYTNEYNAVLTNNTSEGLDMQLILNIRWNVTVPDGLELDGFLVHVAESLFPMPPSLFPTNICNGGYDHFWVRSPNASSCTNNTSLCSDLVTSSQCFCDIDCDLVSSTCKGTGNYYLEDLKYVSVPSDIRFLQFNVDFHTFYVVHIYPYYRDSVHRGPPDERHNFVSEGHTDCISSLVHHTNNLAEATRLCCDLEIPHILARNITLSEPTGIDFDEGTVNISVSWLPPVNSDGLLSFYLYPRTELVGLEGDFLPAYVTNQVSEPYTPPGNTADCDNVTTIYRATITQLYPSQTYDLQITSYYDSVKSDLYRCNEGACRTSVRFVIPAINACDPKWNYCDVDATCTTMDVASSKKLNATCNCTQGFTGNGENTTTRFLYGTGCTDINYCDQNISTCGQHAVCIDNPAPSLNATCACPEGFSGNGYDGCENIASKVIKIVIPVIIVVLLILTYVAWRIRLYRAYKHDIKWSQFVSNDTLIYNLPDGTEMNLLSNVCKPTFGDKWELERSKITIGDIIGRGNYGVVYHGTFLDSASTHLVEGNEYTEMGVSVAIKTVKDGLDEKADLMEFLAEIGFMLNVGDHQNVLGVIGCCTTQKPVLLVTEFLKYGDLLHFLWDAREPSKCLNDPAYHVTEKSLCQMARQVALGMEYLTKTRIIHGDLAARNILVGENLICKISDFGLANDVYRYGVIQGQTERLVPFKWISPERMMNGKVPITSKSDVWSFGNLMYEMVTLGCMPHPGVSGEDLLDKLKGGYRMERPSTCSVKMFSIMTKCWKWRAHSRPSFTELTQMFNKIIARTNDFYNLNLAVEVQQLNREEYEHEINRQDNDILFENKHASGENSECSSSETASLPNNHVAEKSKSLTATENGNLIVVNEHANAQNELGQSTS